MTVTEFQKDFYIFDDGRVRQFLFVGKEQALLVDTGFEDTDLRSEIAKITDVPVNVVMTHADMDHAGGLKHFQSCYVHEKDAHMIKAPVEKLPIAEGDTIGAGDYQFQILHIPGHTYGSIALWERERKMLFPGDSVQKEGPIFLFGEERNIKLYIQSLKRLADMSGSFETVFPCHHDCPIGAEYIGYCLKDIIAYILAYQDGRFCGEKHPFMPCSEYKGKHVGFLI